MDIVIEAPEASLTLKMGAWTDLSALAREVRHTVFVIEQSVPESLEIDAFDEVSLHVVVQDTHGRAIGTGRLLPDGHIGRIAVLKPLRGYGIGERMMRALMSAARERGHASVELSAQCHAQSFYERLGFKPQGAPYQEAGITHVFMRCDLQKTT
ncbi:GNAT family N-acetyltransferase [Pusillimonas sp. T2]|uniref:GNAT family N-acetyltransferase n=1 Tax=Pusillimonas sp. T2 TaxID=1548123 RepID=UPI0020B13E24|nr:GNAT family N-acetyltransferase [Pusillimonas sp. T2]